MYRALLVLRLRLGGLGVSPRIRALDTPDKHH